MGFRFSTWTEFTLSFRPRFSPFEDIDLCLLANGIGVESYVTKDSFSISLEEMFVPAFKSSDLTSDLFDPSLLHPTTVKSLQTLTSTWIELYRKEKESKYVTSAKLTWIIHCGGSQGLEAATIIQSLHRFFQLFFLCELFSQNVECSNDNPKSSIL
jgi:hypothetical protein